MNHGGLKIVCDIGLVEIKRYCERMLCEDLFIVLHLLTFINDGNFYELIYVKRYNWNRLFFKLDLVYIERNNNCTRL